MMAASFTPSPIDEQPHAGSTIDEWVFATWGRDGRFGFISGHRLIGPVAWYWSAVVEAGRPLLHLAEWEVKVRPDPFVVKAPEMWAEHHCVSPLQQWSIGNEAHATALDDPGEALGRAYGRPTPMACDVEWYAIGDATETVDGYEQVGVAHGEIELIGRPDIELVEAPAHRWRRWTEQPTLAPIAVPAVAAHTGLRAPIAFPDGEVNDWVITAHGWRSRLRSHATLGRQTTRPTRSAH